MNLLIYNVIDDSISDIDNLANASENCVYFAISVADVIRILSKYSIDYAILKLEKKEHPVFESFVNAYSNTNFLVSETNRKVNKYSNVNIFSDKESLFSLVSHITTFKKKFKN